MKNGIKYLIIFPDIHGRKYWQTISRVYLGKPEYEFIFLGDYFDPYLSIDGINEDDSFKNFIDLYNTFNTFPNKCTWLLGNHDYHYLEWMKHEWGCRRSIKYFNQISKFFHDNFDKFNIAYEYKINGKRYIFTHAGITIGYAKDIQAMLYRKNNPTDITMDGFADVRKSYINTYNAELLNQFKYEEYKDFIWRISYSRGGDCIDGSCIWADVTEHVEYEFLYNQDDFKQHNIYQIFGHSYSRDALITDNFAMLDCKRPFLLNCKTGELTKI